MKKSSVSLIALLLFAASCKKNNATGNVACDKTPSTIVAPASEQQALQDSLTAHGIQATKDSSGFFYTINTPGTDPKPKDLCSTVATYYRGGFFNGTGFDSSSSGSPIIFQLFQVIPGWQKGISLVGKGGNINLYIPPSLGYGSKDVTDPSTGKVVIPANSYLVFQVSVVDIE